jgi:hypothetical protein
MECLFIVAWRYSQNRFCPGVSWLWDCSLLLKEVGLVCALRLAGTVHALCLTVPQISAKCRLASWLQPGCHTCVILISIIQNIAISTTIWNLHVKKTVLKCFKIMDEAISFNLGLLSFFNSSVISYMREMMMFQKLDLFPSSGERVGRPLLSCFRHKVQWLTIPLVAGPNTLSATPCCHLMMGIDDFKNTVLCFEDDTGPQCRSQVNLKCVHYLCNSIRLWAVSFGVSV